jgi:hypothetical protein
VGFGLGPSRGISPTKIKKQSLILVVASSLAACFLLDSGPGLRANPLSVVFSNQDKTESGLKSSDYGPLVHFLSATSG